MEKNKRLERIISLERETRHLSTFEKYADEPEDLLKSNLDDDFLEEDSLFEVHYGKKFGGLNCEVIEEDYLRLQMVAPQSLAVIISGFNSEYSVNLSREQVRLLRDTLNEVLNEFSKID